MKYKHIQILDNFDLKNIPDLDVAVLGALELFENKSLPRMKLTMYKRPMVVGSGNAEATSRIIFEDIDAVFASESNYENKLRHIKEIDGVILVSASGGKHAPIIAKRAREFGKRTTLITNNASAEALKFVEKKDVFIFPKNREPYTYNTSAYMGMILGCTNENPSEISNFIREHIDTLTPFDFSRYDKFYLIVPPKFSGITRMLQLKFTELFGRKIARDVETSEYAKHATTVVPTDELFISFGYENNIWDKLNKSFNVPLPNNAGYGAMMAVSYYIIGKIQKQHPPYFKENIEAYTASASKMFGQTITPIVE